MSAEKKAEKMREARENRLSRGLMHMVIAAVVYLLVPYIVISYALPLLQGDMSTEGIEALFRRWFAGGIPLVAVGFMASYYGKGNRMRIVSNVIFTVLRIWWLFYVINYGDLSGIIVVSSGSTYVAADLAVTGFSWIIVIMNCLKLLIVLADHMDNRVDYLAEYGEADADSPVPIRVGGRFD